MNTPFLFSNLNEDFLPHILKKFDGKTGVKLYRSCRYVKNVVDNRRITFVVPNGYLLYDDGIEEGQISVNVKLHREEDHNITAPLPETANILKFFHIRLDSMNKDYFDDEFKKYLKRIRGARRLTIATELDDDDLMELIQLAKPKNLSYEYLKYVKKAEFFKSQDQFLTERGVQLSLTGPAPDDQRLSNSARFFEHCGHLENIVYTPYYYYQPAVVYAIVQEWLSGANVGNLRSVRVNISNDTKLKTTRNLLMIALTNSATYKSEGKMYITADRYETAFGKDRACFSWYTRQEIFIKFR